MRWAGWLESALVLAWVPLALGWAGGWVPEKALELAGRWAQVWVLRSARALGWALVEAWARASATASAAA